MYDQNRQYELVVRPRGRAQADEYFHNGSIWIEGREGSNYTIDVTNNTAGRVLFVISVDGLDVLDGKPAGLDSQGYMVSPRQTISIPGWRLNDRQAAEFYFSRNRESYVTSIGGSTANTGVIGAMVFAEKHRMAWASGVKGVQSWNSHPGVTAGMVDTSWVARKIAAGQTITSASVGAAMQNSMVSQEVGTGFGDATQWQTNQSAFERADPNMPDCILAVYYNTARNLEKMGIRLRRRNDVAYQANPFPAYSSTGCKPPPGWNR